MNEVREGSQARLVMTFKNFDAAAADPTSPTMAIHDLLSGTAIRAAAAISTTSGVATETITAAENAMVDSSLDFETHRVTIQSDEVNEEFRFRVRNLAQV
ncbi:hypothetical protein LCGC14_0401170 [marine sediment metagenome]|uniref:Uncharacterized protein n=1 Tax=marine sediment metagenome TaxID=412755 RepID=A0A0F9T2G3_9ZZZZ